MHVRERKKIERNERNVVKLIFEAYSKELKYLNKYATKYQSTGKKRRRIEQEHVYVFTDEMSTKN